MAVCSLKFLLPSGRTSRIFSSLPWGWKFYVTKFSLKEHKQKCFCQIHSWLVKSLPEMLSTPLPPSGTRDHSNILPRWWLSFKTQGAWVCVWSFGDRDPADTNPSTSPLHKWTISTVLNHWHLVSECSHCLGTLTNSNS